MPNPNYAVSTELDAVNQILSSVGQAPVTTLDMQNPEVYTTLQTLREVSRNLQAEGWVLNTDRRVKFTPRADKTIALEFDILQRDKTSSEFSKHVKISLLYYVESTQKFSFWSIYFFLSRKEKLIDTRR